MFLYSDMTQTPSERLTVIPSGVKASRSRNRTIAVPLTIFVFFDVRECDAEILPEAFLKWQVGVDVLGSTADVVGGAAIVADQLGGEQDQRRVPLDGRRVVLVPDEKTERQIEDVDTLFFLGGALVPGQVQEAFLKGVAPDRRLQVLVGVPGSLAIVVCRPEDDGVVDRAIGSHGPEAHRPAALAQDVKDVIAAFVDDVEALGALVLPVDVNEPVASSSVQERGLHLLQLVDDADMVRTLLSVGHTRCPPSSS